MGRKNLSKRFKSFKSETNKEKYTSCSCGGSGGCSCGGSGGCSCGGSGGCSCGGSGGCSCGGSGGCSSGVNGGCSSGGFSCGGCGNTCGGCKHGGCKHGGYTELQSAHDIACNCSKPEQKEIIDYTGNKCNNVIKVHSKPCNYFYPNISCDNYRQKRELDFYDNVLGEIQKEMQVNAINNNDIDLLLNYERMKQTMRVRKQLECSTKSKDECDNECSWYKEPDTSCTNDKECEDVDGRENGSKCVNNKCTRKIKDRCIYNENLK
jgi:hypothetical protein